MDYGAFLRYTPILGCYKSVINQTSAYPLK